MNRTLVIVGGVVLVAVIGIAIFLRARSGSGAVSTQQEVKTTPEVVREPLRRNTDLTTTRSVLQSTNAYLEENPTQRPAPLTGEQTARLREELGLTSAEFNELNSLTFTPLDAHHLELCFLLRDVAASLPLEVPTENGTKPLSKLDQATVAFGWMMRQVRLKRPAIEEGEGWLLAMLRRDRLPEEEDLELDNMALWSALTLRRGTGTALERALLYLALLDQMGIDACLVSAGDDRQPRYWACGVLGDNEQLYLFDTRMGIPLPGPGGMGVATLAEVQSNPAVLGQLTFPEKQQYDVTPEQARKAELHLVSSLSALSPRMKYLQDTFLTTTIKSRLTDDPADVRARFAKVQTGTGKAPTVRHARWATSLLRRSLPIEEGGNDRTSRRELQLMRLAPVGNLLVLLPQEAQQNLKDMRGLLTPPLSHPFDTYRSTIVGPMLEPRKPRDLVLRGRLEEAIRELGTLLDRLDFQQTQLREAFDPAQLAEWYSKASSAHARFSRAESKGLREEAQEARAEIDLVWRAYEKPVTALILGSAYAPRKAQAVYLRTLAIHEQAERIHARLVYGSETEDARRKRFDEANRLWGEVVGWWQSYLNEFGRFPDAVAARQARARALRATQEIARLEAKETKDPERKAELLKKADDARQQERSIWEELARDSTELPKIAALYQLQTLK